MSLQYRLLYRLGFTPWEQMVKLPVREQLVSLFADVERDRGGEPGRALDLGCGSGIWATELAARGWDVTGVDIVERAIVAARRRAATSTGRTEFLVGDVAQVDALDLGTFDFLLDISCFHELDDARRAAMGHAVDAVAVEDATLLLQVFEPRGRNPMLPRGASIDDVTAAFRSWSIVSDTPADVRGAPGVVQRARPHFLRLRRSIR